MFVKEDTPPVDIYDGGTIVPYQIRNMPADREPITMSQDQHASTMAR